MTSFPIVMSPAGYVPQTPIALQQQLIAKVLATNPGYTANLPGSLIEDISSTDVAAMLQMDSSIAEIINSITPYGANEFLLKLLGDVYGVMPQVVTNTSVYVQFTGPPGWVVARGYVASDGVYQYVVQDGGIIGAGGVSGLIYAVATATGAWSVPAGSVTELVTQPPTGVVLTVNNPNDGIPSTAGETVEDYRARTLQAGYAPSQGMQTYLKTLLQNVPGVQKRLVSVRQVNANPNTWEVICGGGDQYAVAFAIYSAGLLLTSVSGSVLAITDISNAVNAVITTDLNHNLLAGAVIQIIGATGMTSINNIDLTITPITHTTFRVNFDSTSAGTYTGNGVVTPNPRNITVPVYDYPDTYGVTFVDPPQQLVAVIGTWNTIATNFVDPTVIAQLVAPAVVDYINSIMVGQPINLFELNAVFQLAVAGVIPAQLLTRIVWTISINGIGASPLMGTGEIPGDPESYFFTSLAFVSVNQG